MFAGRSENLCPMRHASRRGCLAREAAAVVLGVFMLLAGPAHAQQREESVLIEETEIAEPPQAPNMPEQATNALATTPTALDAPVSRTDYPLGPGDELVISIFGGVTRLYPVIVTPEGTVVVPELGVVDVLGLNLDQAEARIRDLVLRFYRNVEVRVTLSGIRRIKVYVVGDVPDPGVRAATAATRASELLPSGQEGILRRNIVLRRASGAVVRIDLARFRQTGELTANPTLREGDALVVPRLDERVHVLGRVAFSGTYEFRPGESLRDLLWTANGGGGFLADAGDTIRVARYGEDQARTFYAFSRDAALGAVGSEFLIQPFDAVYVPAVANFKVQRSATVEGQVMHPGTYPIAPGVHSVCHLIEVAGGFTADASFSEATLRRRREGIDRASADDASSQLEGIPPELLRDRDRQILQIRARGDQSNVVVDLQYHCSDEAALFAPRLEAGDRLSVPRRRDEVTVLGAVGSPGIVRFSPGQGVNYFVALAGGYTNRSDRGDVVVLKAKLGTQVEAREVRVVRAGDTIIVPFEEERRFVDRVRDVNAVLTPIATLIVTVLALSQYF